MPNWCNNILTISHKDADKIDNLMAYVRADDEGKLFSHIKPLPNDEWNYEWCVSNWGTKWDACDMDYDQIDDNSVSFSFDTAWSPPIGVYEELQAQGFEVEAYYVEYGMCFAGEWHSDGVYHDEVYIDDISDGVTENLDEAFAITELLEEWKEQEMEQANA